MFERFKNRGTAEDGATADGSRATRRETAVEGRDPEVDGRDRPVADGATRVDGRDRPVADGATQVEDRDRPVADRRTATAAPPRAAASRETLSHVRARQREEYGGINWGAAFFGWLVAVGVAVLLTGILAAAGAAIGLTEATSDAADSASPETLSAAGAIALLVVLAIAYYCGGYVAGRMSRFDGARQGIGAWAVGLLITLAVAVLAVVAGSEYNVVERANLPRLPIGEETLTAGGAIASIAILAGTLLFAALGGIAGARYHRKVDRAGYVE